MHNKSLKFSFSGSDIVEFDKCLCCNKENFDILSTAKCSNNKEHNYTYLETVICKNCGHIQRSKILSEEWMLKMFRLRDDFQVKKEFNPINKSVEKYRFLRYEEIGLSLLNLFPNLQNSNHHIVDIGCGPGTGLKAWEDLGLNAAGIEPDPSRSKIGQKDGLNIKTIEWKDVNPKDYNKPNFSSIQSLEHFYKPKSFLYFIAKQMPEDSLLYVEVPNSEHFIKDWNDSIYLGHVNNFSEHSLSLLLYEVGFSKIMRIKPYKKVMQNEENLCFVARKSNINCDDSTLWNKSKILEYIKTKKGDYIKNLPKKLENNSSALFYIREINDLMFSYKNTTDVQKTVSEHNKMRKIRWVQKNIFNVF